MSSYCGCTHYYFVNTISFLTMNIDCQRRNTSLLISFYTLGHTLIESTLIRLHQIILNIHQHGHFTIISADANSISNLTPTYHWKRIFKAHITFNTVGIDL